MTDNNGNEERQLIYNMNRISIFVVNRSKKHPADREII